MGTELPTFVRVFGEEVRAKVFGAVALGAHTSTQVVKLTGLSNRAVANPISAIKACHRRGASASASDTTVFTNTMKSAVAEVEESRPAPPLPLDGPPASKHPPVAPTGHP